MKQLICLLLFLLLIPLAQASSIDDTFPRDMGDQFIFEVNQDSYFPENVGRQIYFNLTDITYDSTYRENRYDYQYDYSTNGQFGETSSGHFWYSNYLGFLYGAFIGPTDWKYLDANYKDHFANLKYWGTHEKLFDSLSSVDYKVHGDKVDITLTYTTADFGTATHYFELTVERSTGVRTHYYYKYHKGNGFESEYEETLVKYTLHSPAKGGFVDFPAAIFMVALVPMALIKHRKHA